MVYDPTRDSSYDALVIRDMQTDYGAYFPMQEDVGATAIVSRGPLFPVTTTAGGSSLPNGGEGPVPQAAAEGFTNRAWRFKNGQGNGVGGGGMVFSDRKLFSFANRNSYSIESWAFFEDLANRGAGNGPYYIDKLNVGSAGWRIQVHPTSWAGTLQRGNGVGNDSTNAFSAGKASMRNWMHLVDTFDGVTLRTYIQGKIDSSLAATGQIDCPESVQQLRIGSFMDGLVCRVAFYGFIVLTPEKIAEHFAAGRAGGPPAQPVAVDWLAAPVAAAIPFICRRSPHRRPTRRRLGRGPGDDSLSVVTQAYVGSDRHGCRDERSDGAPHRS
jgi:hypothetical protein